MSGSGSKADRLQKLAEISRVPPFVVVSHEEGVLGLTAALRIKLDATGLEWPVAVRSSASAEDGTFASFAGQYETVLDVRSDEHLDEALRLVASSGDSLRVRSYAAAMGTTSADHRVNVIVQRMIDARAAGVCLTGLWGSAETTLVEAVHGLGDRFVGGEEGGTSYLIEPSGGRLWKQGHQYVGHYLGLGNVPLQPRLRRLPPLAIAEATEVARLTQLVGQHFGWVATDVEFCIDIAGLWLLQARPLTAQVAS